MPATSKAQQRFFGMVHAYQKGKLKNAPASVRKASKSISKEDASHFASTSHDGLPERKKKKMEKKSSAFVAGFLAKCIERGIDVDKAGELYKKAYAVVRRADGTRVAYGRQEGTMVGGGRKVLDPVPTSPAAKMQQTANPPPRQKSWWNAMDNKQRLAILKQSGLMRNEWNSLDPKARKALTSQWQQESMQNAPTAGRNATPVRPPSFSNQSDALFDDPFTREIIQRANRRRLENYHQQAYAHEWRKQQPFDSRVIDQYRRQAANNPDRVTDYGRAMNQVRNRPQWQNGATPVRPTGAGTQPVMRSGGTPAIMKPQPRRYPPSPHPAGLR